MKHTRSSCRIALVAVLAFRAALGASDAPNLALAKNGQALLPVVVAADASQTVRDAAADLTNILGRISGAAFEIMEGNGATGIVVGQPAAFDALPFEMAFTGRVSDHEAYHLRTTDAGLYLLGATDLAIEHAVWDCLYRLGYRQFFPGEAWEIIPDDPAPSLALNVTERPDYLYRRIWYGFGSRWSSGYADWVVRNRTSLEVDRASIVIRTAHMYQGFASQLEERGELKPEYLALVNGERRRLKNSQKFCFSNPEIRRLFREAASRAAQADPPPDSISREPSDLYNWCECADCAALGSISDIAVMVANESAEAVVEHAPNTYVAIYAYGRHSAPPSIRVHSNVVVNIATRLISRGLTVEEMIEGWGNQGATLGIREYYAVHAWHQDRPGRSRGSRLGELQRTIPFFHEQGARFMNAESLNNWGPNGLGYYLAARMLWDVTEAERLDELIDDFFERSFGPARKPMEAFYRAIGVVDFDGVAPSLNKPFLGELYRQLAAARALAGENKAIRRRIDHLALYTRYLEMYHAYATAKDEARQTAFQNMLMFGYRIRNTNMISAIALYRDRVRRDKAVTIPPEAGWQVRASANPWLRDEPVSETEIDAIIAAGIAKDL